MASKLGWVLIAAGVGVVGILAYMAYKTLKPIADTTGRVGAGLKGISDGFNAIQGDFGAAGHSVQNGITFGVEANKQIYGGAGAYLNNLFTQTQAPTVDTAPLASMPSNQEIAQAQAALVAIGPQTTLHTQLQRIARDV